MDDTLISDFTQDQHLSPTENKYLPIEVQEIGKMHFEGNIHPHMWYRNIKFDNGKVDLVSVTLLAEIVYWYRPTYVRDECTGKIISVRKKFKSDILQKSKKALSDQFGLSEGQVQDSLSRLEKMKLIKREFRTITGREGIKISNVLFIRIFPKNIEKITFDEDYSYGDETPYPPPPYGVQTPYPPTVDGQTYTEITTEITENIVCSVSPPVATSSTLKDFHEIEHPDGTKEKQSLQDLFSQAVCLKKTWSVPEIQQAWKVLCEYKGPIREWIRFIDGTITNIRNAKKHLEITKKTQGKKCNSQNSKKKLETTSEQCSESVSLSPALQKLLCPVTYKES